jgi:hypothetical protein
MHSVNDNDFRFSQVSLRYLEELRNEAAGCAHELSLDLRDLAELRLLDPDQAEVVSAIAHRLERAIDVQDAIVEEITARIIKAASGAP